MRRWILYIRNIDELEPIVSIVEELQAFKDTSIRYKREIELIDQDNFMTKTHAEYVKLKLNWVKKQHPDPKHGDHVTGRRDTPQNATTMRTISF